MSDLKKTNCGLSCGFSRITHFCFDCPALMCVGCNMEMHIRTNHKVILFKNDNLQWSDKSFITGLFNDQTLGIKVFNEVNRKLETQCQSHREPKPEPNQDNMNYGSWECGSCTFMNERGTIKCSMCYMFRPVEDFTGEYNSKINKYTAKINPLFTLLDDIDNAPYENSVKEYLKNGRDNPNFMSWFKNQYLAGKSASVINDVLHDFGHDISMSAMAEKYSEYVKNKNRQIIDLLPADLKTVEMGTTDKLLEIEDLNRKIPVLNEMINGRELNVSEIWRVITQSKIYSCTETRMLMVELNLPTVENVKMLGVFITHPELGPYLKQSCPNGSVKIEHVRQACLDHILIEDAINFLKKECCLCLEDFPMPGMQPMLICSHEMCKVCFKSWLCEGVKSRYPCKWGCPMCPDERYETVEKGLHYFNLKEFIVEHNCGDDVLKIFDEKLLNERLMGSPNFHWCANDKCVNGFEAEGQNSKVQCPSCKLHMCVKCNREWKKEHENVTCEEFELWMLKNDPNLAKILNDIGIECPNCGMRYALAPGGCLHFECNKCGWVFCGGCYREFTSKCTMNGCTLGTAFHSHHPRNCLYYMRDYTPAELEAMLRNADYPKLKDKPDKKCPFMMAEEKTLINKPCLEPVSGTTGLCERHYKEYLVQFINRLKIDPATIANSQTLNLMLIQGLRKKLDKLKGESEEAFVVRLKNEVVKSCPMYFPKGLEVAAANP